MEIHTHRENAVLREDWSDASNKPGVPKITSKAPEARRRPGRMPLWG